MKEHYKIPKALKYLPVYALSMLPFRVIFVLSDICYLLLYYVVGYRRKTVRTNLQHSFPEKSLKEVVNIEKAFYRHFTDLLFESAKLFTISEKSIRQRFRLTNPGLLKKYYQTHTSVIMYTAHLGNWEWLAALPLYLPHQVTTFYQPLSSPYFEELMKDSRQRFGAIAVASAQGYKKLVSLAAQNVCTATCIIGDQRPKRNSSMHWTTFLHQETAFLEGADRIARKSNQPVVFPLMTKVGRGRYTVEMVVLEEHPERVAPDAIIDAYAQALDTAINSQPWAWLWTHKRWKHSKKAA